MFFPLIILEHNPIGRDRYYLAIAGSEKHLAAVARCLSLHPRGDQGSLRLNQWYSLTLHIGTHESPVGVIVLKERYQRGGYTNDLPRRYIHEVDLIRRFHQEFFTIPNLDFLYGKLVFLVQAGVSLSYYEVLLLIGGEIFDLLRDKGFNLNIA